MTVAGLNFVGVLVATIVSVASGALWFGPKTFYPIWMKARGIASGRLREDHNPAILFGGTFVGVAVQTVTLGLVITSLQSLNPSFTTIDGAGVGLALGVGIAAFASLSHRLFGGENFKVWIIETANDAINLTIAGFLIAYFNGA
ncbi:MAG: DUF1761 domain-containing protein [Candidatus Limnocylindrus sp.]